LNVLFRLAGALTIGVGKLSVLIMDCAVSDSFSSNVCIIVGLSENSSIGNSIWSSIGVCNCYSGSICAGIGVSDSIFISRGVGVCISVIISSGEDIGNDIGMGVSVGVRVRGSVSVGVGVGVGVDVTVSVSVKIGDVCLWRY
jgi:hypothetical protein